MSGWVFTAPTGHRRHQPGVRHQFVVEVLMLEVRGVSKSFGGLTAVKDVTFSADEGSIFSLIGPNGAGKTTLFNAMTGFGPPDSGTVRFHGREVQAMAPHRVARLGMVRTFQTIRMLGDLTVYESLLVARPRRRRSIRFGSGADLRQRAAETMAQLSLTEVANRRCLTLPLLAQRKIEVARALMCQPKLILLDEPTAGATVSEREELAQIVRGLRDRGISVIVIEHNVPFVMGVSDQIVVLNFGELIAHGTPGEVAADPVVQEVYLGQ